MSKKICMMHITRTLQTGCLSAVVLLLTSIPSHAASSEFGCMLRPMQTVDVRSPVVGTLASVSVERNLAILNNEF